MGESPINLGRLIKNARLEAGLTQDNLATQVGVTPIFYPETQPTNREKEQLIHMIYMCDEREIKIAAATVKALLDAR